MNHTTSKHRKTNRILMAASLLLALTPLAQAGQITWSLQGITLDHFSGSTVTGSLVWDTSLNSGYGGAASAHIVVNYLSHTLDVNTADGATLQYYGANSSGVMNSWELIATDAEYNAANVFNGIRRIGFGIENPPLGFSDATLPQIAAANQLGTRGNGCCDTATSGFFVNETLANAPEPASIALAGPVLGLWLLVRRRRTA